MRPSTVTELPFTLPQGPPLAMALAGVVLRRVSATCSAPSAERRARDQVTYPLLVDESVETIPSRATSMSEQKPTTTSTMISA